MSNLLRDWTKNDNDRVAPQLGPGSAGQWSRQPEDASRTDEGRTSCGKESKCTLCPLLYSMACPAVVFMNRREKLHNSDLASLKPTAMGPRLDFSTPPRREGFPRQLWWGWVSLIT